MDASPCPGEFRYWQHRDQPWARALRLALRAALGFDPAPSDELVRAFAAMYYDADPLAEAFVDEVYLARGARVGRAMLEQALAGGAASVPDAPPSLTALFADLDRDPAWVDRAQVARGARAFRRFGPALFRFAGAITLEGYGESSVAKPLALTGAYAGASTRRRFLETVAFWIAISEPDGLAAGGAGRAAALRVRLMHVFVRRKLLAHPEWDLAAWGVPISQGDALITLMGGSFIPGIAMRVLGYRTSRADIEALMHFWRYVGHLMGVRPRWYPASIEDAWRLAYLTIVKAAHRSGEDGRMLCEAYAKAFAPDPDAPLPDRVRATVSDGLHRAFTRLFVPPWTFKQRGLPSAGAWPLVPLAIAPLTFGAETLRRAIPALDQVADRVARRRRDRWFSRHMGSEVAHFTPVEQFTR